MVLDLLQIFSCGRLLATQSREPNFEWFERSHERFDLAQLTTLRRIGGVQNAELRFLLFHGLLRQGVYKIQVPLLRDLVAKLIGICEVVARLKKNDRRLRQ